MTSATAVERKARSSSGNYRAEFSPDGVGLCVWRALALTQHDHRNLERRGARRFPYPYLVRLTPLAERGLAPAGEPIIVVGKNISESGLCFYHSRLISQRRMIAALSTGPGQFVELLLDLSRCRFTHFGWYENGGRFVAVLSGGAEPKNRGAQPDLAASV